MYTARLHIRHIAEDDWQSIRDIWIDAKSSIYAKYDNFKDTNDDAVCSRVAKWANANRGNDHMFFAVCLSGKVIGYFSLNIRDNGYEAGYCFHSLYHGKGYAKESISALITYVRSLGSRYLYARTALDNTPSVNLLKSVGFKLTGTEKVSFYKDSHGNDIVFDGGVFELLL